MLLAEIGLLSAVDLGKLDALVLEGSGSLLILGSECLAVATPRGVDWWVFVSEIVRISGADFSGRGEMGLTLSQDEIIGLDEVIKCLLCQHLDI